jgi:hypothetical protein
VVDEFISKVKNPNEDQSKGILELSSLIGHLLSAEAPSNFTTTGIFFEVQAVRSKRKINLGFKKKVFIGLFLLRFDFVS